MKERKKNKREKNEVIKKIKIKSYSLDGRGWKVSHL